MKLFNQLQTSSGRRAKHTHGRSFMSLLLTLALVTSGTSIGAMLAPFTVHAASGWQAVGSAGFSSSSSSSISLVLDSSNTPYIAYRDLTIGKATVMKFDGTDWVPVGPVDFSGAGVQHLSLAVNSSGTPYVAYSDGSNSNKATVMKYDSTDDAWVPVDIASFSAGSAYYTSLAIDSADTPYLAYEDMSKGGKATVMKFNGTKWELVGTAGFSADSAPSISLAIDSTDTPYVAYSDYDKNGKVTVMKFNDFGDADDSNDTWEPVGTAGFSAGSFGHLSLVLDSTDTPYVAYRDSANGNKATVMKFDGTSWSPVGQAAFTGSLALSPSLAIDSAGTPYVAYKDYSNNRKATVMKFNDFGDVDDSNDTWEPVGTAGLSAGQAKDTSLAINASGTPYLAYSDGSNGYKITVEKFNPVPTVLTLSPANDATEIATSTNLTITFSEAVTAQSGSITLKKSSDGSTVEAFDVTLDISGDGTDTITVDPSADLSKNTDYYVEIDAGAFEAADGDTFAGISGTTTWSFVTVDTIDPTVETLSPANDATEIAADTNLTITFSEAVTAKGGNITIKTSSGDRIVDTFDVTTDINGSGTDTITINPPASLPADEYYVQVDAMAFDDLAGNSFAGITATSTWNFITEVEVETSQSGGGGGILEPADEDDGEGGENDGDEQDEEKNNDGDDENEESDISDDDSNFENMSEEDARDLLAELKAELSDLQAEVPTETPACIFTRYLERGMQGEDVRCLQQTLNAFGFVLAPAGAGSPGNETIYFQSRTFGAVSRYQAANAAEVLTPIGLTAPTGYFGVMTTQEMREDLAEL